MGDKHQINRWLLLKSNSEYVDPHGTLLMSQSEVAGKSSSEKKTKQKEKK